MSYGADLSVCPPSAYYGDITSKVVNLLTRPSSSR